jgi:hypothetical protein
MLDVSLGLCLKSVSLKSYLYDLLLLLLLINDEEETTSFITLG